MFLDAGIGISNIVQRATARADELSRDELRAGAARLTADVAHWRPQVVAIVGLTAYRQGFGRPRAAAGVQPEGIADAELWVVPNPSGLNAHDTVATLATAYAAPARAAGLLQVEATTRPEAVDAPIRRSIAVSAVWGVVLCALAVIAAQLGNGDSPSRLRTSGRRNGGNVGGG